MAIDLMRRPWTSTSPFAELSREVVPLRAMMDRLIESAFTPSFWGSGTAQDSWTGGFGMDVYESNDAYSINCLLPGVKPEEVTVTMQDNVLIISGESRRTVPEGFQPLFQEIGYGQFERRLTLNAPVDADKAEATYHDGVLTITLPKAESARPRTIKVQSDGSASQSEQKATIHESKAV